MTTNIEKLIKLNELVTRTFRRKHIIVLNPEVKQENEEELNPNITYDAAEWKVSEEIQGFIDGVSQNNELSKEEKILEIYEKICQEYIYDDNLISYIQKIDDDQFTLPDWYGRNVGPEWEKNREEHKRRVCYEVSRYLAKSLTQLFKGNEDIEICIFWDKGLTHYFVGLTSSEYNITLDVDDFNNIKDLTRIKTGLTAQGIKILTDKYGKFKAALDKFNDGRCPEAIQKVEQDIASDTNNTDYGQIEEPDEILFLKYAIEKLKEEHGIDSQGLYEYIKEIVDVTLGSQARKKMWKEIKGENNKQTRYIRCLLLNIDDQNYIVDVDKMVVRPFDEAELKKEDREFIPYKELLSEELLNFRRRQGYDGR